jgi:DNA-binding GntR family transcriptional regulator
LIIVDQVDRYSDVPPWRQIADDLRRRILSGELAPRRPIPSKLTIRQELGVAGSTVDKAVALLKLEGYLRTVHGMGLYVTDPAEWH